MTSDRYHVIVTLEWWNDVLLYHLTPMEAPS
jgi:hypothetical protein